MLDINNLSVTEKERFEIVERNGRYEIYALVGGAVSGGKIFFSEATTIEDARHMVKEYETKEEFDRIFKHEEDY